MRVEQSQNQNIIEIMQQSSRQGEVQEISPFGAAVKTSKSEETNGKSINVKDATYLNPAKEEQKNIAEEIEEGTSMDATQRKNQMAVLSNTTSEEDFAKMQQEGFSLDNTTSNTIVTVTDKIKAELAKAGADVSCFGDELTAEQIEAIAGSPELARQLSEAFQKADLPLTEDNLRETVEILGMAGSLSTPSDGAVKYLLDNRLEPTIENLYMAEYSGSGSYYPAPSLDISSFSEQIQAVIQTAGLEVNEETMETSRWMLENDIPLTPDNISYAMALKEMEFPVSEEVMVERAAIAVEEGGRPKDAMVLEGYTLAERAQRAMEIVEAATDEDVAYVVEHGMELTLESLQQAANRMAGQDGAAGAQLAGAGQSAAGVQLAGAGQSAVGVQLAGAGQSAVGVQTAGAGPSAVGAVGGQSGAAVSQNTAEQSGTAVSQPAEQSGAAASQNIAAGQSAAVTGQGAAVSQSAGQSGSAVSQPAAQNEAVTAEQNAAVTGAGNAQEYTQSGLNLIIAKRQLEELRLVMTAQANYALLRQGISIDTEPLETLVAQLKEMENSYYQHLFAAENIEASEENIALYKEITGQVEDIKYVPAYVLGMKEADVSTINGVHKAGTALKDTFEKAGERYETLMTAPRADLGDSIQKAFRNVGDILEDMGLENSEENRRAVRMLGYNGLEITEASITEMKAADEEVQRTFKNMTPSVVMEMIRQGINPLQMDFAEVNRIAEEIKGDSISGEETRKYSEYLWKLEQNHAISEEERSSYIGIYRLIKQVEKTDGAAIGALVNQGAELTMKNLLTAVRSEKRSGKMEYTVDNDFAGVEKTTVNSITEQAEAAYQAETAYQNNCLKDVLDDMTPEKLRVMMQQTPEWENMTPEQLKAALAQTETDESRMDMAYAKEQLEQLEQAANVTEDIYQVLQKYDIPNTMANVLAMESMIKDRNQMFRKIFGSGVKSPEEKPGIEDLEEIKEELLEEFGEAVSEPVDMAIAQEKLGELAENVMKTMINSENVTSLDVREMRLLSAQLSVSSLLAKEEQYCVPVLVNDEMMNVSVKIVRGVDKKGIVDIMMESELRGKIAATFQAKENGISGLIATDNSETKELFEKELGALTGELSKEGETISDIHCAYIDDLDLNHFSMGMYGVEADSETTADKESESYKVQTSRLYHIAERFIKNIKEAL